MLIIFPFIIITSYLQSELTSFITASSNEIKIEKMDDLINNKFEVFTDIDYRQLFLSEPFFNQIKFGSMTECFSMMKKNSSIACAHDCFYLKKIATLPENSKVLPDMYLHSYYTKTFPVDYPLLPRIRSIYYKLYECGIILNFFEPRQSKKIHDSNDKIDGITLNELRYVFYFLFFAFPLALIVFLIELSIFNILKNDINI